MKPFRRRDRGKKVYRVRIKGGRDFKSALLSGRTPDSAASSAKGGRILSVTKVGMEELLRIGDYFKLGDQLMKEFREEGRHEEVKTKTGDQN